ncbi:MAG: hypothetical protein KAH56_01595 [Candidatus Krumholzibacteria bacterium]|nr:hypothetical protein [Candidatus Krumholzibacteria bacterium]
MPQPVSADSGRDSRRVSATVFADGGIAAHSFCVGSTQFAFAGIGLDCHAASGRVFVDVDLDWGAARWNPPGGPFMCSFVMFGCCLGFVLNFHLPDFQKRRHRLQHELRAILSRDTESYPAAWKLSRALISAANLETDRKKSKALFLDARTYAQMAVDLDPQGTRGCTCLAICASSLSGFAKGHGLTELIVEFLTADQER